MSARATQSLVVQPCPFCGGAPRATRLENTKSNGRSTVLIGCSKQRRCSADLVVVRGTSFGDACINWNLRHHAGAGRYSLKAPMVGDDTTGVPQ